MPAMSEGEGEGDAGGGGRSGLAGGSRVGLAGATGARVTRARLPCGLAWLGLGLGTGLGTGLELGLRVFPFTLWTLKPSPPIKPARNAPAGLRQSRLSFSPARCLKGQRH